MSTSTSVNISIKTNPIQKAFLTATERVVAYFSGRGGSKTASGAIWSILMMLKHQGIIGLACANNPAQCHTVVLKELTKWLDHCQIPWVFGEKPKWFKSKFQSHVGILSIFNGSQLILRSAYEYDRTLRGLEVAFLWIDEARDLEEKAYDTAMACLRGHGPNAPYQARLTSTPRGFDWMHRRFVSEPMPNSRYILGRTTDNAANLPDGYENLLRSQYGATFAAQELEAKFVNLTEGRVYEFDRIKHVQSQSLNPALPLVFTLDFNVSPLIGEVLQVDGRVIRVIDELCIRQGGQTRSICEEFVRRYQGKVASIEFMGDQAGAHGDTRGNRSDIEIMRSVLKPAFAAAKDRNDGHKPKVVDRVNAVNALLNPASGPIRLLVDPKAINLTLDLEQLAWKPGTKEINKGDDDLSHACFPYDALIDTPVGQKTIGNLRVGDPIYTHLGIGRVEAVMFTGVKELCVFEGEGFIICTPDHRFYADGEWHEATQLNGRLTWGRRGVESKPRRSPIVDGISASIAMDITNPHLRMTAENYIKSFGKTTSGQFLKAWLSTIGTTTRPTTTHQNTSRRELAPINATQLCPIKLVCRGEFAPVYSIKTSDGSFFADGYLVSNSDALGYYVEKVFPVRSGSLVSTWNG